MFVSTYIKRMTALQNKYQPEDTKNCSPEVVKEINKEIQSIFDEELWLNTDVMRIYGLSRQNLNNISRRYNIPGRFKLVGMVVYDIEVSKPWFDAYVAQNGGKNV